MSMNNKSDEDQLSKGLHWRCIGPPRGGRVVAVAGDPSDSMTFYFGACAGGIWKTSDGGTFWENVSDGYLRSATIGALAVAESDPNVIYAGTGETTIRTDVSYGDGVYKSSDGGKSWAHLGLADTQHIGEIRIHPKNPDIVYVAAFGHAFGPNQERGVYRSVDGGRNWQLVLHQNDRTGAIDIAMDVNNPRILFAAFWEAHRNFWHLSSGGPGSALFRSTDGGDSWEDVSTHPGFAVGIKGKIGVSVSPVQSGRVWALVEAEEAGLYRSDDNGDTWQLTCGNRDLLHRPWYYMHVFADPCHADTVYVNNLQMWKSTDGGVYFTEITTPHGDNHALWIDPKDNRRMIQGNDGGANVSFNGGLSWSTIYNQLTAQFYRMDIDNQFPYRVYATQQDNTSISVPSATEWGAITMNDCLLPGTGESGFIAVHPEEADIVYVGAVGSSPGGNGALQRYDHRTRQIQLINVWPEESLGIAPRDLRFRFAWTFPIVFSPHDSDTLYVGGNHVFRSRDEGRSWQAISPDLSRNDPETLGLSGGPITGDSAGAEQYATLSTLVESPHRRGELWAGTDDGLVHVSRDGGDSWNNVTPSDLPQWAYIGALEISRHHADTVYLAATRYKLDDYKPYLFCTEDGGNTWRSINGDLPQQEITRVIRADPVSQGLLFVGTETGVFYTLDDGRHWLRMQGGIPVVPVYDLKIKHSDLVAATHGRSFWILDDITPLRQMTAGQNRDDLVLFTPRPTYRFRLNWSAGLFDSHGHGKDYSPAFGLAGTTYRHKTATGETVRRYLDVGENPPNGAIIYYWLDDVPEEALELCIRDASGEDIICFSSSAEEKSRRLAPVRKGLNRFIWDLHYPAAEKIDLQLLDKPYEPFSKVPEGSSGGPLAPPGVYKVKLAVGERIEHASFEVLKDPRIDSSQADFDEQFALQQRLTAKQSELHNIINRMRLMKRQLRAFSRQLADPEHALAADASRIIGQLEEIEGVFVNRHRESPNDVLRHTAGLNDALANLMDVIAIADAAPPNQAKEVADELIAKVDAQIGKFKSLVEGAIAALNNRIAAAGIQAISA